MKAIFIKTCDFFYFAVRYCISIIARCFPVRKNMIIFSSIPPFSDNAMVLYDYLKRNRPDLDLYWAADTKVNTKNISPNKILTRNNRLRRDWIRNRAYYLFGSHGVAAPLIKPKQHLYVNINHGSVPIKRGKGNNLLHYENGLITKHGEDFILCRGEGSVELNAGFWCIEKNKVLPLGMMRDDLFIKNIGDKENNPFYDGKSSKLIIWMPTFRKSPSRYISEEESATETGLPLIVNEEDVVKFDSFLKDNDIQLIIKIHPLQSETPLFKREFSKITIVTNELIDNKGKELYEIIGYSDSMITDYSSVYFDYLIVDRPLGFILDDYEKYERDRGFMFENPKEIMAGSHIYNINDLKQFVMDVKSGKDDFKVKRKEIRDKYVGEVPESTCQRFVDYFHI